MPVHLHRYFPLTMLDAETGLWIAQDKETTHACIRNRLHNTIKSHRQYHIVSHTHNVLVVFRPFGQLALTRSLLAFASWHWWLYSDILPLLSLLVFRKKLWQRQSLSPVSKAEAAAAVGEAPSTSLYPVSLNINTEVIWGNKLLLLQRSSSWATN